MSQGAVIAVLLGTGTLIAAWDVWLNADDVPGNTITEVMRKLAKHPIIPWGIGLVTGVLAGHIFWVE